MNEVIRLIDEAFRIRRKAWEIHLVGDVSVRVMWRDVCVFVNMNYLNTLILNMNLYANNTTSNVHLVPHTKHVS